MSVGIGSAVPLWQGQFPCVEVIVQNSSSGQHTVLIGNQKRQTFELYAGSALTIPICDAGLIYVKATTGSATINWLAMT